MESLSWLSVYHICTLVTHEPFFSDGTINWFLARNKTNRERFLDKLQSIWIDDKLTELVNETNIINIALQQYHYAEQLWVANPDFSSANEFLDHFKTDYCSTSPTVLWGQAGAGKTILLLRLLKKLIVEARGPKEGLIPVYFELETWTRQEESLSEWVIKQFENVYQVHESISKAWVEHDWIVYLFDGLDKVANEHLKIFFQQFEEFCDQHNKSIVIGSRFDSYNQLPIIHYTGSAIQLMQLGDSEIDIFLKSRNIDSAKFLQLIDQQVQLLPLIKIPLWLNIISKIFQEKMNSFESSTDTNQLAIQKSEIFATYVDEMLKSDNGTGSLWSTRTTINTLCWIAHNTRNNGTEIFTVDTLQPDLLNHDYQLNYLRILENFTRVSAIFLIPVMPFIFEIFGGQRYEWIQMLSIMVSQPAIIIFFITILAIRFLIWSVVFGSMHEANQIQRRKKLLTIQTIERVSWSPANIFQKRSITEMFTSNMKTLSKNPAFWIFFGIPAIINLYVGFLLLIGAVANANQNIGLGVLYLILLIVVVLGFSNQQVESTSFVNQRIWLTFKNGLFACILSGCLLAPLVLYRSMTDWLNLYTLGVGMLFAGFIGGWYSIVQHYVLRYELRRQFGIPFRIVEFFRYTNIRNITIPVGNGFSFIHDLLSEYFANSQADLITKTELITTFITKNKENENYLTQKWKMNKVELQIFFMMANGITQVEIAKELSVSLMVVYDVKQILKRRFKLNSDDELYDYALNSGIKTESIINSLKEVQNKS